MGPSLGAQRQRFVSVQKEDDVVFACNKFTIIRLSRDRYRYKDALSVHIKSASEIDVLMKQVVEDSKRLALQITLGRQALRTTSTQSDAPPPAEIIRKVQIEPTVRAVPPWAPRDKATTEEAQSPIVDKGERMYRAPPRRTRAKPASPSNDSAPLSAEPVEKADKPKRRAGGMAYLRQLLAAQEAEAAQPASL